MTRLGGSHKLTVSKVRRARPPTGAFVAQAYVSTQGPASPQDARLPHTHENGGRPQGFGGAAQEGPPSPHAHLNGQVSRRRRPFPAPPACCALPILKRFTVEARGEARRSLSFSRARTAGRAAVLAPALKKRWVARWCATGCGGASAKFFGGIFRRYPQDGT